MHRLLTLALAVGMFWTNIPYALCACGQHATAATAAPKQLVRTCPRCGGHRSAPADQYPNQGQKPCQCGACEVTQALPPTAAATVLSPTDASSVDQLAAAVAFVLPAVCHLPEKGSAADPPGTPTASGRALTIFLGRLLI
jgi:hypothetical protein